ncbi:hypothetical protein [Comamonas brasiliensis]|uniref:hypothetical protein n=1 Tax=Comamonas brasiliensis TaxID=1812482 RepID=UPI001B8B3F6A|nr:hypothetical protein [Comamonas sp. PE63]
MTTQLPKNVGEALSPVTDHIDVKSWEENQPLCLGGAGASLAVLLVAVQVAGRNPEMLHHASTGFAAAAIPIWLALWQLSDTNAFWRVKGVAHSKKTPWLLISSLMFVLALVCLYISVLCLLSAFSPVAAITWLVFGLFFGAFVAWHSQVVSAYAKKASNTGGKPKVTRRRR